MNANPDTVRSAALYLLIVWRSDFAGSRLSAKGLVHLMQNFFLIERKRLSESSVKILASKTRNMAVKKEIVTKSKAGRSKVVKAEKARKTNMSKERAQEWNTLTAFKNLARCTGFALLVAIPTVLLRIFPSISFGFFDAVFAVLGLAVFFGSIGFILCTVYGGREPYRTSHRRLNAIFVLLYFLMTTFGVVAVLTLMARRPDIGEFYSSFTGTVTQYVKMMPVFGIFIGLALSYIVPNLFLPKEAKMNRTSPEKVKTKLSRQKPAPKKKEAEKSASEENSSTEP